HQVGQSRAMRTHHHLSLAEKTNLLLDGQFLERHYSEAKLFKDRVQFGLVQYSSPCRVRSRDVKPEPPCLVIRQMACALSEPLTCERVRMPGEPEVARHMQHCADE